jgi:hypothetical protein
MIDIVEPYSHFNRASITSIPINVGAQIVIVQTGGPEDNFLSLNKESKEEVINGTLCLNQPYELKNFTIQPVSFISTCGPKSFYIETKDYQYTITLCAN